MKEKINLRKDFKKVKEEQTCIEKVFKLLVENKEEALSIKAICYSIGYSEYAVRKALKRLIELNKVRKISIKGTNKKYYTFYG